jgi:hypothetical protein
VDIGVTVPSLIPVLVADFGGVVEVVPKLLAVVLTFVVVARIATIFDRVVRPTRPEAGEMPSRFWKAITALLVSGPKRVEVAAEKSPCCLRKPWSSAT